MKRVWVAIAAAALTLSAHAGKSCDEKALTQTSLHNGMAIAQQVQAQLSRSNAVVAIVGRIGMDLSEYKVTYTHAGIAFKVAGQPWRIVHLLNSCGTAISDLWLEGLGNFFLDDLHSYDAVLMLPSPAVQQRLLQAVASTSALRAVHNPAYSMVAYPFALKYQNSNEWILEMVTTALSKDVAINSREQSQNWLKLAGFQPAEMRITPLKRLGARMFKASVAFDDHPNELRFSDRIQTVTVDSMVTFFIDRNEGWRMLPVKAQSQN